MISISKEFVTDCLKKGQNPAASCKSGDIVCFSTRDCYDDNAITADCPAGTNPHSLANPATGPLFVEGAEPGDMLKVEILSIALREYGIMRSSVTDGPLHTLYQKKEARVFPLLPSIVFDEKLTIPSDTMIGVIGTAPDGEGISTITPGIHGGNMDCTQITVGSTVYLPVFTSGALLSIGDLHARMGDGEVFICGLETAGDVTVRVTVLPSANHPSNTSNHPSDTLSNTSSNPHPQFPDIIPYPFVVNRGYCMTIQSAPTLDEACNQAALAMEAFLRQATGIDDLKAGMLMSLLCNMVICQVVNPLKTVRAEFPLDVLETYGVTLP